MTTEEFEDHYARLNRALVRSMTYRFGRGRGEDVAQQAWMNAFKHRDAFRGDCAFATWIMRIALNAGIEMIRAARSRPEAHMSELTPNIVNSLVTDDRTEQRMIAEQELSIRTPRLNTGIYVMQQHVKQRYADVYRMRFVLGMDIRSTSLATGLCANTVKTYTSRIKLKLTVNK